MKNLRTLTTLVLAAGACGPSGGNDGNGPGSDASTDTGAMHAGEPGDAGAPDDGARDTATTTDTGTADTGSGPADFAARCAAPGVIKCVGFDQPADIQGVWGDRHGTTPGMVGPDLDTSVKASGNSSLRFTIPGQAGTQVGSYFTNFSDDLSVQFGESSEFYVQWRQRFAPDYLSTVYGPEGSGVWKLADLSAGDQPGCSSSTALNLEGEGGKCASSCTAIELVTQNYTYNSGFPYLYNSCSGSTSHGPYDPFEQPYGAYDFKIENAMPAPYCLYSQGQTNPVTYYPPSGNCAGFFANEWMTFQVHVTTGPRVKDEWMGSHVQLFVAREGKPSQVAIDYGPYNLTAGDPSLDEKFGKVWLLPYNTFRNMTVNFDGHTWYDELVISHQKIADPQ